MVDFLVWITKDSTGSYFFSSNHCSLFISCRDGTMKFVTITDRGPNAANANYIDAIEGSERPFIVPEFGPTILRLNLNRATGEFQVAETIPLYINSTTRVTGFSNLIGLGPGLAYSDETPIDIWVNLLPFDPLGLDTEGIKVINVGVVIVVLMCLC
jgi:hypothetical protein